MASMGSHRGMGFATHTPSQHPHVGHGSAERGRATARPRDRERDRNRGNSTPTFIRFNAVGEQETMDWLQALETVNNRIDTMERNVQMLSTSLTQFNDETKGIKRVVADISGDIPLYKEYVEKQFSHIKDVTVTELTDIRAMANNSFTQHDDQLTAVASQIAAILDTLAMHHQNANKTTEYNMATPVHGDGNHG